MKILHIDSSPRIEGSASRELSGEVVRALRANGGAEVIRRDLGTEEVPHLKASTLAQIRNMEPERHDPDMELTRALINELLEADVLVLGAPMYNFTVPTQLKSWIDRVVWAGKTFRYTPQGPEGFCKGKRAYIASSRGGIYTTPEKISLDFHERYLTAILGFIGIVDIRFFRAEGIAISPERREATMNAAIADIQAELGSASLSGSR